MAKITLFSGIPVERIYAVRHEIGLTDRQRDYVERVHAGYVRDSAVASTQGGLDWKMEQNILKKFWRWQGVRNGKREMA